MQARFTTLGVAVVVLSTFTAARAVAQTTPPAPAQPPTAQPENPSLTPPPSSDGMEQRLRTIEEDNRRMREELERLKAAQDQKSDDQKKSGWGVSGYLDFGLFYVSGNGSGIRSDNNFEHFPEFRQNGVPGQWVFYGDPLSTMINARGEPADLGDSRAITFDSIHNRGRPSFIVNSLNVQVGGPIVDHVRVVGSVDFLPRTRDVSIKAAGSKSGGPFLGDFIDVKLAYAEWTVPTDGWKLVFEAGKVNSPFGIESKVVDAPDRLMVTPSLACRYHCGRPTGLKGKTKFANDHVTFDLSVTNGSVWTEGFGFADEIDSNRFKTITARLAYDFKVGKKLELGASHMQGAQDLQLDDSVQQAQSGFDLTFQAGNFDLHGEFVGGTVFGKTNPGEAKCATASCIEFLSGYAVVDYKFFDWVTPFVRWDARDATHESGTSFVYKTSLMRVTSGLNMDVAKNVLFKGEYTHVEQLGRAPQFANEVATTSLVVKY